MVLSASDLDVLELVLGGFTTPAAISLAVREPVEPATAGAGFPVPARGTLTVCDAENTPVARLAMADTPAASGGRPVVKVTAVKALSSPAGLAGTQRPVRVADMRAQVSSGRAVVIVEAAPTRAELADIRARVTQLSMQRGGGIRDGALWIVPSARRLSHAPAAERLLRMIKRLIDDGEAEGELLAFPRPVASADDVLVAGRPEQLGVSPLVHSWGGEVVATVTEGGEPSERGRREPLRQALMRAYPEAVVREVLGTAQPGGMTPPERGAVVLFTGLSGSGKSTVAKALCHRIEQLGAGRAVVIDGDEARQVLSDDLGFDRASRDRNVVRLGYAASLVAQAGGIGVLAPIAPFAEARMQVRRRAEQVGAFLLVHVATPLQECEARDRKGLYARARSGRLPDFTGISSPYEEPDDADVVVDTSVMTVDQAVDLVYAAFGAKNSET